MHTAENFGAVFDVDRLASIFKCSTEKIKRMCRSGELPAFKFGKSWYVHEHALEQHLASAVQLRCHLRCSQQEKQ